MKTAYFDAFSGLSGDMIVGAILDCGADFGEFERAIKSMPLTGYRLSTRRKVLSGISALKFDVAVTEPQPERHFGEIRALIDGSPLAATVKHRAISIFEVLAQAGAAPPGRHAVVGQFVGVPAEPDAQADPSARQMVQGGDAFRQRDWVVLDRQRDRGGQSHPRRHRACGAQADPGVQRAHIAVVGQRFVTRGGVGRLALDRNVGVFWNVERLKAVVVGKLGGCRRGDATIAGEKHKAVIHGQN